MRRARYLAVLAAVAATTMTAAPVSAGVNPDDSKEAQHHGVALDTVKSSPSIGSRGPERGDREPNEEPQPPAEDEPQAAKPGKDCPEDLWTVPVQLKGLACVLLLPKPDDPEDAGAPES